MTKTFYLYFFLLTCTAPKLHSSQDTHKNCAQCEKKKSSILCDKCGKFYYCSKGCQVNHWELRHYKSCEGYCGKPISKEMFVRFIKHAEDNGNHSTSPKNPNIEKEIDEILPKGLAINTPGEDENTVLHIAIKKSAIPVVKYLLTKPVDINQKNNKHETPLITAFEDFHSEFPCAILLLDRPEIDVNVKILEYFICFILDKGIAKQWKKAWNSQILFKLLTRIHHCIYELHCLQKCLQTFQDPSNSRGMNKKNFRSAMNLAAMHYIFWFFNKANALPELRLFKKDYLDFLPNPLSIQNPQLRKLHPYYDYDYDHKVFLSIAGCLRRDLSNMCAQQTIDGFSHIIMKYYLKSTFRTFIKSMAILDDDKLLAKAEQEYKPVDYHKEIKETDLNSFNEFFLEKQTRSESIGDLYDDLDEDATSGLDEDVRFPISAPLTEDATSGLDEDVTVDPNIQEVSSTLLHSGVLYPPISAAIIFVASRLEKIDALKK